MDDKAELLPFLKWAGGKRWFLKYKEIFVPPFSGKYLEPFLGGGAVYFSLRPSKAVISDSNPDLIEAYMAIRDNPVALEVILKKHHVLHSKEYYYQVRGLVPSSSIERAARFIYLNRTCWNGLYRVNLKGEFNVPMGTKTNVIYEGENFVDLSAALKRAKIMVCDFEETFKKARCGDFMFVDPPYTVKHNNNGFVKYNESIFSWSDQERLKRCVDKAVARGVKVLVTNANHDSINELYGDYERLPMERASVISGSARHRGIYNELIIRCW